MIVGFVVLIPFVICVPETRQEVLLVQRARRLRKETGNKELYATAELRKRSLKEVLLETVIRPVGKRVGFSLFSPREVSTLI